MKIPRWTRSRADRVVLQRLSDHRGIHHGTITAVTCSSYRIRDGVRSRDYYYYYILHVLHGENNILIRYQFIIQRTRANEFRGKDEFTGVIAAHRLKRVTPPAKKLIRRRSGAKKVSRPLREILSTCAIVRIRAAVYKTRS